MKSKYHSRKVVIDGITFDSKREATRYKELKALADLGQICSLERQVKYVLIPAQYEMTNEKYKRGAMKGLHKQKLVERECSYYADFVYMTKDDLGRWHTIVEDTKGVRTPEYIIKRKLLLKEYGIKIREI